MAAYKNSVLIVLALWISFCHAQFRVWRADTRTPDEIRAAGGFLARGNNRALQVAPDISMFNHALGAANGASRDNDGYVSTTADENTALSFLNQMFGGNGYIYEVAASPSFIQVSGTLGQFSPFPNEQEYAALGGFNLDQVIGWVEIANGTPRTTNLERNPDYASSIFDNLRPNNGEPRLAGFPASHEGWRIMPWLQFAAGPGCGGGVPRLRARQESCAPVDDAVTAANRFLDETCFSGSFC